MIRTLIIVALAVAFIFGFEGRAKAFPTPLGNAFTYQGQLKQGGSAANGTFDFQCRLFDALIAGTQIGTTQTASNVQAVDGLFSIDLDFGAAAFDGNDRFLDMAVRTSGGGLFIPLAPRQKLAAAPYAHFAKTSVVAGTIGNQVNFTNASNSFVGSGASLTSLNAANLTTGTLASARLSGTYANALTLNNISNSYFGSGAGLTGLSAGNIATGTLSSARLPTGGSWSLSTNLSVDSPTLVIDPVNNRVGIGTATPSTALHVLGEIESHPAAIGASFSAYDTTGVQTVELTTQTGGSIGGALELRARDGSSSVRIGDSLGAGSVLVRDSGGINRVFLDGEDGSDGGGKILIYQADGTTGLSLDGDNGANAGGVILVHDPSGAERIRIEANENGGSTSGSDIKLMNQNGTVTIEFDADQGGSGDGRVITQELQITGGSDLSEQFDIASSGTATPTPGMVVCIDPLNPGKLVVNSRAYDRTVAGVISGAGDIRPGMLMSQRHTKADGQHPVALTGRVYVMCDASELSGGAIQPGDLLTTSSVSGHAMRVADHDRAQGAIIGKAMTSLSGGRGLVLVLVTLQ